MSHGAFALGSVLAALLVVATAARFRGRFFAIFSSILLLIHDTSSIALFPWLKVAEPAVLYLQVAVHLNLASLSFARTRPGLWHWLVAMPAHFFVASSFFALPWALAASLGFEPHLLFLPFLVAAIGVVQSLVTPETDVNVVLDGAVVEGGPKRHPHGEGGVEQPLRIAQISDPHLGPWMSPARLRRIVERAIARDPDIVVLTGDYLTMETHRATEDLSFALEPLRALEGRVFAVRGNHDHEAPRTVARAMESAGVRLLIDDAVTVETPAGKVQIVGFDFHWNRRGERMRAVCEAHPRIDGALRLVLLHDPGAFKRLPEGEGDLVLSGHTHGGQVGLVSLGGSWTPVWAWTKIPDHGLFARGRDRLYVHRGTGHYGFPLRVGVPAEESILRVHWKR